MTDFDDFFSQFPDDFDINPDNFSVETPNNETSSLGNLLQSTADILSNTDDLSSKLLLGQECDQWGSLDSYPKMEDLFEATGNLLQSGHFIKSEDCNDQPEDLCPFSCLLSPSYKLELPEKPDKLDESFLDFLGSQICQNPPMEVDTDTFPPNDNDIIPFEPLLNFSDPPDVPMLEDFPVNSGTELVEAVQSIKLPSPNIPEKTLPMGAEKPRINCSRIQYMENGNDPTNVVRFSTYPARKKTSKQAARKKAKSKRVSKYDKMCTQNDGRSNSPDSSIVLPVGESGCQIAIPSTIPVHFESFLYDKDQTNKYPLVDSTNKRQLSDQAPSPVFKLTCNGCVVEKPRDSLPRGPTATTIVKKVLPASVRRKFTVDPSFAVASANPQTGSKSDQIQILKKMPANHQNFYAGANYSPAIRENMDKITAFLYSNVSGLTGDIVNALSVPVFIVRRGSLSNNEFDHLLKQVYILQKLKTFSHHVCYEANHCLICKEVTKYKSKLIELKKWKHFSEMTPKKVKHNNNFSSVKVIDRDFSAATTNQNARMKSKGGRLQKHPLKFQVDELNRVSGIQTLPVLHFGTNNNAKVFLKDQLSSILKGGSIFNVRQLDIGKVTTVSDDNHNGITLFFLENSFFYEIELQNEFFNKNNESNYKIFYISVEVPFSSLCRLQTPRDQQIELVINEVPLLQLISKRSNKRMILSEEKIPLSDQQKSLVSSMRTQLAINLTHKLHLIKRNFKLVKNCFKNACHWLDISNNPVKPISAYTSCQSNVPFRSEPEGLPATAKEQKQVVTPKRSAEEKSVVLINIFSGDPSKDVKEDKIVSDDPVWTEGKAIPNRKRIKC